MVHLSTKVSYYTNITATSNTQKAISLPLSVWLGNTQNPDREPFISARDTVLQLRNEPDPAKKKNLKLSLPGIVTGCHIEPGRPRHRDNIETLTGWMQVDIDPGDNPSISDWAEVRDELSNISYFAYTGLSSSGRGVWALVKVRRPELLKEYHTNMQHDIRTRYGITIDPSKGGNPTDLRFYSYDPGAVIKDKFKIYDRLPKVIRQRIVFEPGDEEGDVWDFAHNFTRKNIGTWAHSDQFKDKSKHHYLYVFCCALNRLGVPQSEAESYINANMIPLDKVTSNCITYAYQKNTHEANTWKLPKSEKFPK